MGRTGPAGLRLGLRQLSVLHGISHSELKLNKGHFLHTGLQSCTVCQIM